MIPSTPNFQAALARKAQRPVVRFEIEGYGRAFSTSKSDDGTPWIQEVSEQEQSIDVLEATATIGDLSVTVLDKARTLTADLAGTTFEGKVAQLKVGFEGLPIADYTTLFSGVIDSVPSSDNNTAYEFTCKDLNRLNQVVIYLLGDDGQPCSSDHPRTVVGNPLDILLSILRDEVGWADHDINIAKIQQYRDEMFGGMAFEFHITSPPEAKGFIETELLKPLGGWAYFDAQGRYTIDFLQPLGGATASLFTFTDRNLIKVPTWQQLELVNVLSYRFDQNDDKFMAEIVQQYASSIDKYGQQGQRVIESAGVRSGFGGSGLTGMVARAMFQRFGTKNPMLELTSHWEACLLECGDYVTAQHPLVPDRERGVMGIDKLFQITRRRWDFQRFEVDFDVIDASKVKGVGRFRIAPDATPNWTQATQAQRDRYLFIGNNLGKQSDGTDNGLLG